MHCKSCDTAKGPEDFYASNRTRCKECIKTSVRANRLEKIDHYRAFDRARASQAHRVAARASYRRTAAYAESHKAASVRWEAKHPERRKASTTVHNAIRDGKLTPWPVCAIPECSCKPEAHHPDYSRPLDVVWLCDGHHKKAHVLGRALAANRQMEKSA